jgi:hypothetical protein
MELKLAVIISDIRHSTSDKQTTEREGRKTATIGIVVTHRVLQAFRDDTKEFLTQ